MSSRPIAVHFGAGNIGRGFVGLLLHNAGYEVVFADVNAELIDLLASTPSYQVNEVGAGATTWTVDGYRALNSATHEADVVAELAKAAIVTTAVGPNILKFVAPVIAAGLAARPADAAPLAVMACENAIGATDTLRGHIEAAVADATVLDRAVFANTAVDRIVPGQPSTSTLDVTVEAFFEWAIERPPFGDAAPAIEGAHFVDDLAPYIERKLFTVNTGHATAAYFGAEAGVETMFEAFERADVVEKVRAVLLETKTLLITKHGFDDAVQQAYLETNLTRFANPGLHDTVERVGRQPLRKLSRHERFVGPAAELAERGIRPVALVAAMGAALRFEAADDPQVAELHGLLESLEAEAFVPRVMGIEAGHPLFDDLVALVSAERQAL